MAFSIAIPILGVVNSNAAEEFYCGRLGFRRAYVHRPNANSLDPCWMGVVRDGAHIVLSSFAGDGPPGSRGTQILIDDAVAVQREFRDAGVECSELVEESWGHVEFNVVDPDGNRLNFAQDNSGRG
jgi:catechol 2,3-dioxygenase-like lactoylglutathione lyase family enzyme